MKEKTAQKSAKSKKWPSHLLESLDIRISDVGDKGAFTPTELRRVFKLNPEKFKKRNGKISIDALQDGGFDVYSFLYKKGAFTGEELKSLFNFTADPDRYVANSEKSIGKYCLKPVSRRVLEASGPIVNHFTPAKALEARGYIRGKLGLVYSIHADPEKGRKWTAQKAREKAALDEKERAVEERRQHEAVQRLEERQRAQGIAAIDSRRAYEARASREHALRLEKEARLSPLFPIRGRTVAEDEAMHRHYWQGVRQDRHRSRSIVADHFGGRREPLYSWEMKA